MRIFRCCSCGTVVEVPGHRRYKATHVKTMWCWRCKGVRQFKLLTGKGRKR